LPKKLEDGSFTCSQEPNHGYDNCFIQAIDTTLLDTIGCTAPFATNSEATVCQLSNFTQEEKKMFLGSFNGSCNVLDIK
jgi:hypothetical protein